MTHIPTEDAARLVAGIEAVTPLSPELRRAFFTIPRLTFVPRYYQRCEQPGEAMRWQLVEASAASVAQDDALVTQLDPVTQFPTSSSSQPSAMALQLEALDLHPGQRVLEIGSGTGYNTALLAEMVGPTGQVTTMDIDAQSVQSARTHLAAAGLERVSVHHGDGLAGFQPLAPYDRIIATGSFYAVPSAWLEQLTPGGVLVGNLVGNLASVFLRIVKEASGIADGFLLPLEEKRYMELHHGQVPRHHFPPEAWYEQVSRQVITTPLNMPKILAHPAFLLFLQCALPEIQRYWRAPRVPESAPSVCLTTPEHRSVLMIQGRSESGGKWTLYEYGEEGLWRQVQECYTRWEQLGKPAITSYTFTCRENQQWLILPQQGERWPLPSAYVSQF